MSEQVAPDTRNKSRERSKTPFHLRSQCDGNNCKEVGHVHSHAIKRNPTVPTITEEQPVTNQRTASTKSISVTTNVIYTETNNVVSNNRNQNSIGASLSSTKSIVTVPAITTTKVNTKSSQSSSQRTVRKATSGRTEINEHEDFLDLKHSTPKQTTLKSSQNLPKTLEYFNLNEHLAYKEYKEAGEYWKKYPKTDYVYSPTYSPFRREIQPGVIAMPNMSRRSLESFQNRTNEMTASNSSVQESICRSRYQSNYEKLQNFDASEYSQDELDVNGMDYRTTSIYRQREEKTSIVRRFFTAIVTIIVTTYHKTCRLFTSETDYTTGTDYRNERYAHVNETTGFFSSTLASIFRYIYIAIASIQFWDSCVLQSSSTENRGKKRFLLFLLLLLLAAGLYASQMNKTTSLSDGLPLALQSIQTMGYDFAASTKSTIKSCFDFNWNWPFIFQSYQTTTNHFPSSSLLSDQQYADLVKHIDAYIEHIITTKSSQSKGTISPEANSVLIASIVKESIINYKYQLSLEDIERIANAVRQTLSEDESRSSVPLDQHKEYIANVVRENVNLYASAPKDQNNDELKIDDILVKVFGSSILSDAIHKAVVKQIDPEQQRIGILESKIEFMTDRLSDKTLENQDLKHSLDVLKREHDKLAGSVNVHNDDVDLKLKTLLNDVDAKFTTLHQNQYSTIDSHVKSILIDIMGYDNSNGKPTDMDLKAWIQNVFVAKSYLEQRLNDLSVTFDKDLKDELHRSAAILIKEVGEQIKKETLLVIESRETSHAGNVVTLDEGKIRGIVKDILAVYDADKTGLVDYALESAGGEVLSTRCTENYEAFYRLSIFGIPMPFTYPTNTPRTAISPTVQPGNCWSFQGFPGFLVLKLSTYVFVSGFTMEHIPKTLAPNGKIESAPKNFSVWGLESESDREPIEFGNYTFLENGSNLQYFAVQNDDVNRSFNVVELRVESNHGNQNFTCLYRFRVHGRPDT